MLLVLIAFVCLGIVSLTFIIDILLKLFDRLLVLNFMLLLSVRLVSRLLVHTFLKVRALTVLAGVFFLVVLPVMRLPWFGRVLVLSNWRDISVLTVVVASELIVAELVEVVAIWVYKRTILVDVKPIFIINTSGRESILLTLLVILLLFY
jgi:hypothetical protein